MTMTCVARVGVLFAAVLLLPAAAGAQSNGLGIRD